MPATSIAATVPPQLGHMNAADAAGRPGGFSGELSGRTDTETPFSAIRSVKQCGHWCRSMPIASALPSTSLQDAEQRVREALSNREPGERLDALLLLYRVAHSDDRYALFANLAARLTLIPERFHAEAQQ